MTPRGPQAGAAAGSAGGRPTIQSAARTVRLIALLLRAPDGFSLAQLSEAMGLRKVTALRLLQTLVEEGIAHKEPDSGRYRLNALFWLAVTMSVPRARLVQDDLQRVLDSLARMASATAVLAIPYIGTRSMTTAAFARPDQAGAVHPAPRPVVPMHTAASGRCYLAGLSEAAVQGWLRDCVMFEEGLDPPEALARGIEEARRRGYAVCQEELAPGWWSVAVPVADATGAMVAALQLWAPLPAPAEESLRRWVSLLQGAAQRTSRLLASLGRAEPHEGA